ncbi:hypothetical protein HYDPIDRAFT_113414 [Hydnomerulius pinastri MD-312]|uniref:Unplaced genomic scaffold scaffold_17, whole genome shotgun sequence n=1 Tax=Hydnomerulius pinastri MD-312 TaxID=994086 RepID=A0A0C9W7V5_9AGAM|nr:hypothetical protein HYDPIDRAFT_113414 [Hydnomerulius pinastri MD-312]
MDSQVTLVDPAVTDAAGGNIVLEFDRDDMKNATICIRGEHRPSYFVNTPDNRITTIHAGDFLLATVERKTLRPDLITFRDSPPMNLSDWLKSPVLSAFPITLEEGGRRLEWRENFVGQLSLHDPSKPQSQGTAVAWFTKSRRRVENGKRVVHKAFLVVKPEVDYMRDIVVVSCLLAEHKLRMKAKNAAITEGRAIQAQLSFNYWAPT